MKVRYLQEKSIQFMAWGNKTYPKSDIFPLAKGFLLDVEVPVPRLTRKMLIREYGKNFEEICKTHYWSHRKETVVESGSMEINCSDLAYVLSFTDEGLGPQGKKKNLFSGWPLRR